MWLQKTRRSLSLLLDKRVWFSQYFQLRSFSVFTMHGSYILNFPAIPGDISLSRGVKAATEMQAEAEHKKRAQSNINISDGMKNAVILASEATRMDQVN
ncbi:hypothetical protein GOBAR_DD05898 [Gossypium barbadense]|nr:hypothetical protein GOBAR_DD05898 [Gossypium barbadense]